MLENKKVKRKASSAIAEVAEIVLCALPTSAKNYFDLSYFKLPALAGCLSSLKILILFTLLKIYNE